MKKRDKCIKRAPSVNPNFDENIQVEDEGPGYHIIPADSIWRRIS